MNTRATQQGDTQFLQRGLELSYIVLKASVLMVFVGMSIFPAQALAFVNDVELTRITLEFNHDPSLDGTAIVGIEAFATGKTVGSALESNSLNVRSTLTRGSVVRVLSMAYSSTPGQTDSSPTITASGKEVGPGTIAANFLPFGTRVRIGNKIYTVTDRMNSRYDNKYVIDIWKPSKFQAIQHGVRILEMKVLSIPGPQSGNKLQIIDSLKDYLFP